MREGEEIRLLGLEGLIELFQENRLSSRAIITGFRLGLVYLVYGHEKGSKKPSEKRKRKQSKNQLSSQTLIKRSQKKNLEIVNLLISLKIWLINMQFTKLRKSFLIKI